MILGLYKISRTEKGNTELLKGELQNKLLKTIFGNNTQQIIDRVATFTGNTFEYSADKIEGIA